MYAPSKIRMSCALQDQEGTRRARSGSQALVLVLGRDSATSHQAILIKHRLRDDVGLCDLTALLRTALPPLSDSAALRRTALPPLPRWGLSMSMRNLHVQCRHTVSRHQQLRVRATEADWSTENPGYKAQ